MAIPKPNMYIYHLPYTERRNLCFILDNGNKWEELGKLMKFEEIALADVKKEVLHGRSPANELLTLWGNFNHTVLELYVLLYRMESFDGMKTLKSFVDDKYHALIKKDNLDNELQNLRIKNSKVPTDNFDKNSNKTMNKEADVPQTTDNNVTQKDTKTTPTTKPSTLTACVASSAGGTPQIPYQELEVATNGWSCQNILGQGGFGVVFKGTWKWTKVAIKRLEMKEHSRKDFSELIRQSVTELHCLNAYRHDNILPLYGFSIGGPHPCLVYQFMPGGSLDARIRTRDHSKVLSWPSRLNIATGTARGLQFLHTTLHGNKPLIHGDIKSANILLDLMDLPRIGDFGLAREGPEKQYTHIQITRVHGTLPYLPEDFLRSKQFSTKVDTFSFGVVLFELATGCPPATNDTKKLLKDYVLNFPEDRLMQLKDTRAPGGEVIFENILKIGKMCVEKRAKDRPEMVQVMLMLEGEL